MASVVHFRSSLAPHLAVGVQNQKGTVPMMLRTFVLAASTVLSLTACGSAPAEDAGGEVQGAAGEEGAAQAPDDVGSSTQGLVLYPPPVLIDFDRAPSNTVLADGAVVDTAYSALGVTFTCVACSSGHAYSRALGRTDNGVSLFQAPYYAAYDARYGAVRADFASPRTSVTIDVRGILPAEFAGTPVARPWLEAYDATNTLVGRAYYPSPGDPAFGTWQTLRVDAPAGKSIQFVRFSSQNFTDLPAVYARFDNLTFNSDPIVIERPILVVDRPIKLRPFP